MGLVVGQTGRTDDEPRLVRFARVLPSRPPAELVQIFEASLAKRHVKLDDAHLQRRPERWFDSSAKRAARTASGRCSRHRTLLGEGISHAVNFGMLAADSAIDAAARKDYAFAGYQRRVAWGELGRRLQFKGA